MSRREGRAPSQRQLRVGEEIRHALAWIVERGELHDPQLAGRPLTVTEVRMSPDLRTAVVFVTPLGGGDMATMVTALNRARSFLRRQVGHAVNLKYVPDLRFVEDGSFDQASRIDSLLHDPSVARDLEPPFDDPDEEPGHGS